MKILSETEKAYLAGIMDGEGSIGAYIYRYRSYRHYIFQIQIMITTTNRELVDYLTRITGGIFGITSRPKTDRWKETYWLKVYKKHSKEFLRNIFPYLVIKKHQAQIFLDMDIRNLNYIKDKEEVNRIKNQRDRAVAELKVLNVRRSFK